MGNCQRCLQQTTDQQEIHTAQTVEASACLPEQSSNSIWVDVKTWQKESYSLFDYENNQFITSQTFQLNQEGFLYIKYNKVFFKEGKYQMQSNETLLLPIEQFSEQFSIMNYRFQVSSMDVMKDPSDDEQKSENQRESIQRMRTATNRLWIKGKGPKIWIVTRCLQNNGYDGLKLKIGDILKLGRIKLEVKCIQLEPEGEDNQQDQLSQYSDDNESENTIICKVCLSSCQSETNPLIDPCKCNGGSKYIHLKCLMFWLQSRAQSNCNNYCTVLIWKKLECEICKYNYPPVFVRNEKRIDLIELSKPKGKPYIILEFKQKKQNEQQGDGDGLYIINFGSKRELRIGRNHEVEVSINDISVSRTHATIKMVDQDIILQDKNSKFGTLALLKNHLKLLAGLELQVKRTLFQFQSQEKSRDLESLQDR